MMGTLGQGWRMFRSTQIALALAALTAFGAVAPAEAAGRQKLYMDFMDFPAGTECGVANTTARVTAKTIKTERIFTIKDYQGTAEFFCKLPTGKTVFVDYKRHLPADFNSVSVTVVPSGKGHLTINADTLYRVEVDNLLR